MEEEEERYLHCFGSFIYSSYLYYSHYHSKEIHASCLLLSICLSLPPSVHLKLNFTTSARSRGGTDLAGSRALTSRQESFFHNKSVCEQCEESPLDHP